MMGTLFLGTTHWAYKTDLLNMAVNIDSYSQRVGCKPPGENMHLLWHWELPNEVPNSPLTFWFTAALATAKAL
jgi:hypothetical protein